MKLSLKKNEFYFMKCHKKIFTNKNGESSSCAIEAIAKERGIRGYYKLRKAELIRVLEATKLVEQKSNIFDEPIPNDPTPVLQPTGPSNITRKVKQNIFKKTLLWVCKRLKILASGC